MGRARWRKRKVAMLVAVAATAVGAGVLAYATHLLGRTELQTIDARFSIRGSRPAPSNVAIVTVDNATLQAFARRSEHANFPFPRVDDARVIDRLREAGAKVIAVDLQFTQQTDRADDNALIEAIGRAHGKVVLGTTEVEPGGETGILGGNQLLAQLGARPASVRLTLDSDGVTRRFPYSYNGLGSLGVVSQEVATGRRVRPSLFPGGTLPIDFVGPPGTVHQLSYWNVMRGEFPASAVRGKVVIVGVSAPILQDVHSTATTAASTMAGPEIWANALATLSRGGAAERRPGLAGRDADRPPRWAGAPGKSAPAAAAGPPRRARGGGGLRRLRADRLRPRLDPQPRLPAVRADRRDARHPGDPLPRRDHRARARA